MKHILLIGGFDPSGCAGVLADARAVGAVGGCPVAAVTAITFQSERAYHGMEPVAATALRRQLDSIATDCQLGAIKIGLVPTAAIAELIAEAVEAAGVPTIWDPVLRSSAGGVLVALDGLRGITGTLLPRTRLVTPNLDEAEVLTGTPCRDVTAMERAARLITGLGAKAALVKGGHLDNPDMVVDVLDDGLPDCTRYASPRIAARVRGTGCALASCIATYVAAGNELAVAVDRARRRVAAAMAIAQHAGETRLFSSETCTAEAVTLS